MASYSDRPHGVIDPRQFGGFEAIKVSVARQEITAAMVVPWNPLLLGYANFGNIVYTEATGLFTLEPGKIYELEAQFRIVSGSNAYASFTWFDSVADENLGTAAYCANVNASLGQSTGPIAHHYIQPAETVYVGTRCITTGGVAEFSTFSYARVKVVGIGE